LVAYFLTLNDSDYRSANDSEYSHPLIEYFTKRFTIEGIVSFLRLKLKGTTILGNSTTIL